MGLCIKHGNVNEMFDAVLKGKIYNEKIRE